MSKSFKELLKTMHKVFDCSDAMIQLLFTKTNVKPLLKYLLTEMKGFKIFK